MKLLRNIWSRRILKREIDEELRFHIEQRTAENIAAGMSPKDAMREARKRFGNVQSVREECRERHRVHWGETIIQDIRFGARLLRKSPGFTAIAVLSLTLGIGANTAIFSLVNAILLRSLPVPNPQELRVIQWSGLTPKFGDFMGSMRPADLGTEKKTDWHRVGIGADRRVIADAFSYPLYLGLREHCAARAELFGYSDLHEISARVAGGLFVTDGMMVTGNFFSGLGVKPVLGRLFTDENDRIGTDPVVVISHAWWQKRFGLDPGVLGQTVTLNRNNYTIIGVLPREFAGVDQRAENEFYVPMSAQPQLRAGWDQSAPNRWWVRAMARVKPGVGSVPLQAAFDIAFAGEVETVMKEPKIEISSGRTGLAYEKENYRRLLLTLLGIVGTVLLVACANLAGLSLARGAARQHELAVRAALGAGRGRLIRQSLTESLVLALLGGALGILLAIWGKTAISRLLDSSPTGLRYDLSLDLTVLGFTLAVTVLTGLLSGLLPALRAGHADPLNGLKERAASGMPRLRAGRLLVTAQIAFSVLLLAVAGLYVRTMVNLKRTNPGFVTENVLLFHLNPITAGIPDNAQMSFYDRTQEALAAIPGVRSVGMSQLQLLSAGMSGGSFFKLPSRPELNETHPQAHRLTVSETFFKTLEIPILLGRGFTSADGKDAPKVAIVNETFVRNYLPKEYPVGQILTAYLADYQIIGVCGDAKYTGIKTDVPPTVYFCYRQDRSTYGAYYAVRTALPPLSLVPAARKAVAAVNPDVPLSEITTQALVRDKGISNERMFATLCGTLAGLALLLACIGLYGLMAYNVARRTNEIGIRMALGATHWNITWPILREAGLLAIFGGAIGICAALGLTRLIESQLYGVAATDPASLTGAAVLLMTVALLAAWLPARRAARVNPMEALRRE